MRRVDLNGAGKLDSVISRKNVEAEQVSAKETDSALSVTEVKDEVKVSDKANTVQQLVDKVSDFPSVRQEKIDSLRGQIKAGTYNPSSKEIADAILKEEGK